MVLMKTTFASSYFLVFYALFLKTPRAYREAAELDGAGNWTIYFKVYLPMVMNSAVAVFLLLFIGYWNDYATPMLFWPSRPTISQGLYEFQNSRHRLASDPVKFAGSFLVCLPSLAVFLIFREKIMNNVTMGGLKG
jgi:ABC-type glycerol-3-phosphate transport system permease component